MITWKQWATHAAQRALVGGLFYALGLLGCWAAGETYSGLPDWVFRLTFILFIIWGVWTYRLLLRGNLPFSKGLGMGMAISIGLAAMMSLSTWLFQTRIEPQYNANAKAIYAHGQHNKMVVTFLQQNDQTKLQPQDEQLLQSGLQKHLAQVDFFFTTGGAIAATWIYALVWGFGVSATIAFLSRPTPAAPSHKLKK